MGGNFARPGGGGAPNFNRGAGAAQNFNRANVANRPTNATANVGNRTQVNSVQNRQNTLNQSNVQNRQTNIGNNVNSGNRVINNNVTNVTNVNRGGGNANRWGGYGYGGAGGGWPGRYGNGYANYHSNWVHGYWNNNYPGWGYGPGYGGAYFGSGFGTGLAIGALAGWGLSSWGYGSSLYGNGGGWGYSSYANPYYMAQPVIVQQPQTIVVQGGQAQPALTSAFNYSEPIATTAPPPDPTVAEQSTGLFDQARDAFKANDPTRALGQKVQALKTMPGDTAMHEFRALCLFALGQYDAAASALFAVLSVGPGWDWSTMASLYPDVATYTTQLRALEAFARNNPNSASAHFVLGYHYLTAGYTENADREFTTVSRLKPNDKLSAQLAQQLSKPVEAPASSPTDQPAAQPPAEPKAETPQASPVPPGATISGSWSASPAAGVRIVLVLKDDNTFSWTVSGQGPEHTLSGDASYAQGLLTLTQKAPQAGQAAEPPLVGTVTWKDATHMAFKIVGGGPEDPGLAFGK